MTGLILPNSPDHPDFWGIYNETIQKSLVDREPTCFIVPADGSGLAIPANSKLVDEYFGDGEYDRRLTEIELEEDSEEILFNPIGMEFLD